MSRHTKTKILQDNVDKFKAVIHDDRTDLDNQKHRLKEKSLS